MTTPLHHSVTLSVSTLYGMYDGTITYHYRIPDLQHFPSCEPTKWHTRRCCFLASPFSLRQPEVRSYAHVSRPPSAVRGHHPDSTRFIASLNKLQLMTRGRARTPPSSSICTPRLCVPHATSTSLAHYFPDYFPLPAEPTNGIITVPDIATLQAQMTCAGHSLLAAIAGDLYRSTAAIVPSILCPASSALCNAGVSFGFQAPPMFAETAGACEQIVDASTAPTEASQGCALMQCAMLAGVNWNTDSLGSVRSHDDHLL